MTSGVVQLFLADAGTSVPSSLSMAQKQLELEFSCAAEDAGGYACSTVSLSKPSFEQRTRDCFSACEKWMEGWLPAFPFWAGGFGVHDQTKCEWEGTFADADRVKLLKHDWTVAANLAIAIEVAAEMIEEHCHDEDCGSLVRSFYLAIAFRECELDMEQLLPGIPVHIGNDI